MVLLLKIMEKEFDPFLSEFEDLFDCILKNLFNRRRKTRTLIV